MANVYLLVDRPGDFSFPSDHSTAAATMAGGLMLASRAVGRRGLGYAALAAAVVQAFSRVYVGAHYPGDVLAGLALGTLVAVAPAPAALPLLRPLLTRLRHSPLHALVTASAATQ